MPEPDCPSPEGGGGVLEPLVEGEVLGELGGLGMPGMDGVLGGLGIPGMDGELDGLGMPGVDGGLGIDGPPGGLGKLGGLDDGGGELFELQAARPSDRNTPSTALKPSLIAVFFFSDWGNWGNWNTAASRIRGCNPPTIALRA